jgi:iron(III) transport system ATP-binding protein
MTRPLISVESVSVSYGSEVALDDFSLDVPPGSLLALVGPSGCGKTTALRVIAGFQRPESGRVTIHDMVVVGNGKDVPPEKRNVGMVFQEYALFPHISVAENVGYGVRGADRVQRVHDVLKLVGLEDHGARFPHELSGGEQQRVALARALAPQPDVVLLDEPFSNLDAPQRERMRRELRKILKGAGATAVFVTHDQSEALAIADVIAIMRGGRIVQSGIPDDVYAEPIDPWVARFLGDAILLTGTVENGKVTTVLGDVHADLPAGSAADVMIRPEWISPRVDQTGGGKVIDREFYGHDQRVEIELPGGDRVEALVPTANRMTVGDRVTIEIVDAIVYPKTDDRTQTTEHRRPTSDVV